MANKNLFSGITENKNFDVVGKRHIWFVVPAVIITIALIIYFAVGMNVGIDFSSGIKIELYDEDGITDAQYTAYVNGIPSILEPDENGVYTVNIIDADAVFITVD